MSHPVNGQHEINYSEEDVPAFQLPQLLQLENGKTVSSEEDWIRTRRPEILKMYKEHVYGHNPEVQIEITAQLIEEGISKAFTNTRRKQVRLKFENQGRKSEALLLIFLPLQSKSVPIFVGYNFYGNHTTCDDNEIILTSAWIPNKPEFGIRENKATEESRGVRSHRWSVQKIIDSGFGLATMYYGDIDPDRNHFDDGIHPLFYKKGQEKPGDNEWASIGAWAWGLSTALDYLETDEALDHDRVIVMGHSRLGKTSLWAGALDERFAIVISNNSGCGGSALFRRKYGETIRAINSNFPHWFNSNFKKFNDREDLLPIDQHMLIALQAPRPVYITSASEDLWADPRGEYLSCYHASDVYHLFGRKGIENSVFPEVNTPIQNDIGYHRRKGKHDVTDYDWQQFIAFAKIHLD